MFAAYFQVTPTGKEILKNINLGMYLGAKIGVLGSNGSGEGVKGYCDTHV
jgi:ABC-type polysaccharide/polyol phosphate transport system ATPase subunit